MKRFIFFNCVVDYVLWCLEKTESIHKKSIYVEKFDRIKVIPSLRLYLLVYEKWRNVFNCTCFTARFNVSTNDNGKLSNFEIGYSEQKGLQPILTTVLNVEGYSPVHIAISIITWSISAWFTGYSCLSGLP